MVLLCADTADPLQTAIDYYQTVAAYQVILKSLSAGKSEVIRYYFQKPGYVRLEFETSYRGAVLIYHPFIRRAKLWPFGHRNFPALSLSPENSLIQSPTGQRVDQSDVGTLYENIKKLRARGYAEVTGVDTIGGRESLHMRINGGEDASVGIVSGYRLWLDCLTGFPSQVSSLDRHGRLLETVEMADVQIDPEFPDGFFDH